MIKDIVMKYEYKLRFTKAENFINEHKDELDTILSNSSVKLMLAQKIYDESLKVYTWKYYRDFILHHGVNTLLKIYNSNTIDKLVDRVGKSYIIIATMLENDVNRVLDYALVDKEFFDILRKKAIEYYRLFSNVDNLVIDKYVRTYPNFISKYFILDNEKMQDILANPELPIPVLTCLVTNTSNSKAISWFFTHVPRADKVFLTLSKEFVRSMVYNGVTLPKRILSSDYFFECIVDDYFVNIRKLINKIIDNYGYLEIEDKLFNYYQSLLNERFRTLSDIVVDYLFKDDIYNVFINIREILGYHETCGEKLLSDETIDFFKMILNIDNLSKEERIDIFNKYHDKKIYLLYYNSLYTLKKHMYNRLHNALTVVNSTNKFYDFSNNKYYLLVRCLDEPFDEKTVNRRDCYSLINEKHNEVFYGKYTYGYNSFDINKVIHVYEHDAFSYDDKNNNTTNYVNRLFSPKELMDVTSSVNEIQINNCKDDNDFLAMKPDYLVAIDEINEDIEKESKRLNIPIVLISSSMEDSISYDESFHTYCNPIESDYSVAKYTLERGITEREEKIRVKERFYR